MRHAALAVAAGLCFLGARAQQLEPRSYSNIPLGMNFLVSGYVFSDGCFATY
jgi:hypothetical protein